MELYLKAILCLMSLAMCMVAAASFGAAVQRFSWYKLERYASDVRWMAACLLICATGTFGLMLAALGVF